jgi:heme exporter protein B
MSMWRDAALVAGKDLRIERRSQVGLRQILPFALTLIVIFAFALDTLVVRDSNVADARTSGVPISLVVPGLLWVTMLLCTLLAIQRSIGVESPDGARDALRLSSLDPAGIFLGKTVAVLAQLGVLIVVLSAGMVLFYDARLSGWPVLITSSVLAIIGLASTGTAYAALAGGTGVRETILPILFLPAMLPVLLGAVRSWQAALDGRMSEAWPWVQLLVAFVVVSVGAGMLAYGALMEE